MENEKHWYWPKKRIGWGLILTKNCSLCYCYKHCWSCSCYL